MFVDSSPLCIEEIEFPYEETDDEVVFSVYADACAAQQRIIDLGRDLGRVAA